MPEEYVRLALLDVDGDADMDVVFANIGEEGNAVYLNDGTGLGWQLLRLDPEFGRSVDVAAGDFDGDGLADLAFASLGENAIFLNDGSGRFRANHQVRSGCRA